MNDEERFYRPGVTPERRQPRVQTSPKVQTFVEQFAHLPMDELAKILRNFGYTSVEISQAFHNYVMKGS